MRLVVGIHAAFIAVYLAGCVSQPQSTYEIAGVMGRMSSSQAEQAQMELVARRASGPTDGATDKPLKFLRAPQPIMPAENISSSTAGSVTASVRFAETGEPEQVSVKSSTSESLSRAVVSALQQWRIEPPTRNRVPVKFTVTQTFVFKVEP